MSKTQTSTMRFVGYLCWDYPDKHGEAAVWKSHGEAAVCLFYAPLVILGHFSFGHKVSNNAN